MPNCDSDGKADNKRQAFINTNTRRFKIQMGDMGPPSPGRASLVYEQKLMDLFTSLKTLLLNSTYTCFVVEY